MKEIVPIAPIFPPNGLKEMVDEGLDLKDTRMEALIRLHPVQANLENLHNKLNFLAHFVPATSANPLIAWQ